jgi:hypothetical protein
MHCTRPQVAVFRMAAVVLTMLALFVAWGSRSAQAQTLKVDANYEISGAGYKAVTTSDGTGALPHKIALPAGSTSITFAIDGGSIKKRRCTAACITIDGGNTYNDADGVGNGYSANLKLDESISGIQSPTLGFVTGVFESGAPTGEAPATLDFNTIGTDFTSLSPVLQQLFFIGDGLTGDGAGGVQVFYVPSGAKKLYLGITDDNNGDLLTLTESYDAKTKTWATLAPMPEGVWFAAASAEAGGKLYCFGGGVYQQTVYDYVQIYQP